MDTDWGVCVSGVVSSAMRISLETLGQTDMWLHRHKSRDGRTDVEGTGRGRATKRATTFRVVAGSLNLKATRLDFLATARLLLLLLRIVTTTSRQRHDNWLLWIPNFVCPCPLSLFCSVRVERMQWMWPVTVALKWSLLLINFKPVFRERKTLSLFFMSSLAKVVATVPTGQLVPLLRFQLISTSSAPSATIGHGQIAVWASLPLSL